MIRQFGRLSGVFEITALRILIRHEDFQGSKPMVIFSCTLSTKVVIMRAHGCSQFAYSVSLPGTSFTVGRTVSTHVHPSCCRAVTRNLTDALHLALLGLVGKPSNTWAKTKNAYIYIYFQSTSASMYLCVHVCVYLSIYHLQQ